MLLPHAFEPFDAMREEFVAGEDEFDIFLWGTAEAFMLDFDASGGMASIYGNYMIELQTGPRAGMSVTGPIVTVYKKEGRTWRIRSQVFVGEGASS